MPSAEAAEVAAAANGDETGDGWFKELQRRVYNNYQVVAWTLVITTWLLAFGAFTSLRLVSLLVPTRITFRRTCERLQNETIVINELHYASVLVAFLAVGFLQVACFFLLTISTKWLTIRRTYRRYVSLEERLRFELVISIKRVMFVTVLPTFLVYAMCSTVTICAIVYMVALRDVHSTAAQVLLYVFDAAVGSYLLAFPLLVAIYSPQVQLRRRWCHLVGMRRSGSGGVTESRDSPPSRALSYISNVGNVPAAHLVAYRQHGVSQHLSPSPEARSSPRQLQITESPLIRRLTRPPSSPSFARTQTTV